MKVVSEVENSENSVNCTNNNHYQVNENLQLDFNAERAEFFRIDIKDLTKMLDGTPSEKDALIMKLIQENQLLREDNEVFRTMVQKLRGQVYKMGKFLKKLGIDMGSEEKRA